VRIWGVDRMARPFAEIVRVRNVSNRGAVLMGLRSKVQTGEVLDVQQRRVASAVSHRVDESYGRSRRRSAGHGTTVFGMDIGMACVSDCQDFLRWWGPDRPNAEGHDRPTNVDSRGRFPFLFLSLLDQEPGKYFVG